MRFALATSVAVALAAGCAAPIITPTLVRDPKFNYPASHPSAVAIYTNPPAAEYEVIGQVRPAGSQQPIGTSGAPGGGGVATLPTQTGRTEEVTIQVHEKEITGVVIRLKK